MVPGNVHRNAEPPYTFTNAHVVCHRLKDTPLRPSWIRSPGRMQNTYANEAFMDELAAAAGADPVEFRLRYLKDPRGAEVIKAAAERAGWETRPSPKKPDAKSSVVSGRGFAYVKYGNIRTYVATAGRRRLRPLVEPGFQGLAACAGPDAGREKRRRAGTAHRARTPRTTAKP